jgi:hypothetical protein
MELANNLRNRPTTCGTGQQQTCGAGQQSVELAEPHGVNKYKAALDNCNFLVLLVCRGRRGPALTWRPDKNKLAAFLFFMSLLSKVNHLF